MTCKDCVYDADGKRYLTSPFCPEHGIASVPAIDDDLEGEDERRLALYPELLEALKQMLAIFPSAETFERMGFAPDLATMTIGGRKIRTGSSSLHRSINRARAAIAKAEGK